MLSPCSYSVCEASQSGTSGSFASLLKLVVLVLVFFEGERDPSFAGLALPFFHPTLGKPVVDAATAGTNVNR